jgi:hypothetical protein
VTVLKQTVVKASGNCLPCRQTFGHERGYYIHAGGFYTGNPESPTGFPLYVLYGGFYFSLEGHKTSPSQCHSYIPLLDARACDVNR